jgi:hypothetical protein
MDCKQIQEQYNTLRGNITLFRAAERDFKKERVTALACKKNIENALSALSEVFGAKIRVENMPSPFAEVYTDNGLPVPEKETQNIDLEKQLEEDCAAYRSCGLESWADDIETFKPRLKKMSKETKAQIAKEMQEGAIAIFMPGRAVQYKDAVETLTKKLKPVWTEEGKEKTVTDGYLDWGHLETLKNILEENLSNIPEGPYTMLTKPTQKPELTSMTVDEQLAELLERDKKRKRENKPAEYTIMNLEYAAMQKFFTERAKKNKIFKKLDPLDKNTFARFVGIPFFSRDFVEHANWNSKEGHLSFNSDDEADYEHALLCMGVRLAVRI